LFCALGAAVWKSILTDKLAAAGFPSPAMAKEGDGKITGENEAVFFMPIALKRQSTKIDAI
jgi:hypothetical protein